MDKAEAVTILVLLLLALFLRELNIDRPLYGDEADWYKSALMLVNGDERWTNTYISDSPPLGKAIFVSFYAVGFNDFRQVTVLFAMASLVVTYLLARDFLGRRSALLSLIVLATSAYAIIGAQHVDRDGGMLAFFAMLVFYGYLKYAYAETQPAANRRLGSSLHAFL
ncbi:MAG: glycosyltransferase family 39 protein, partial [Candidatus Burarchaeum sp.]